MKHNQYLIILALILMALGVNACAPKNESPPQAWIDYPSKGAQIQAGETITIISHAYAVEGVGEMLLTVNGRAYRRDAFDDAAEDFDIMRQNWTPTEAGDYLLQVRPYDTRGNGGYPDTIQVHVVAALDEQPSPTPPPTMTPVPAADTSTPTPTATPTQANTVTPIPTATPVPTDTPTPVPTATPAPTNTPTPVPTATPIPTNTPVPPPTATPVPADTTAPPGPIPAVPADGLTLSCRSKQTLVWQPVSDPSGIAGYYVTLEREIKAGQWDHIRDWGPIQGKQLEIPVDCGVRYRWRVRARDGAGNIGNWSTPSHFAIGID